MDYRDYRRASNQYCTWAEQFPSILSKPSTMIKAHSVPRTYYQAHYSTVWQRRDPRVYYDFNPTSYSDSQGPTMCTDCWSRIANEVTSSCRINLLRDINPIFTYSTSVALPRQHELSPVPGFSFDHDEIQPIATTMAEFELNWPSQGVTQQSQVPSTRLPIGEAILGLAPMSGKSEEYSHNEVLLQELSDNVLNYGTHPSKNPSIRNLLNNISQIEHIGPEWISPTSLKALEDFQEDLENICSRSIENDTRGKKKQLVRAHAERQTESTALVGLRRLDLNTPLTMADDSQTSNSPVVSPGVGSSASYEQYDPEILQVTPSTPWNQTWISGCFFTGVGSNSLGRYAYTNMIFPRRLGGIAHTQITGCDVCGTFITFALYLAPEIFAVHAGVLAYFEYLEYHLVLRLGVEIIEDNPALELTISNDLFQITDHYMEDHSTPHWVILHSNSWEEIKAAIIQGMAWSQPWYPHKPGYQLNRTVLYVQLLRYLLMCKVLIFAENVEFGGDRWETPRSELPRGSIAHEFTYWAGLHLFNFWKMCDYGNIRGFVPEANGGMGAFMKEDYNGQHY